MVLWLFALSFNLTVVGTLKLIGYANKTDRYTNPNRHRRERRFWKQVLGLGILVFCINFGIAIKDSIEKAVIEEQVK